MGQQDIWKAVVGDSYARFVKRAIEEVLEIFEYILILFGVVETFFLEHDQRSQDTTHGYF